MTFETYHDAYDYYTGTLREGGKTWRWRGKAADGTITLISWEKYGSREEAQAGIWAFLDMIREGSWTNTEDGTVVKEQP